VTAAAVKRWGDAARLLRELTAWSEQGWLRRLDAAFAGFMLDLDPKATPPVVMAAALVAHMEGQGHACLPIDELLRDAEGLLGWPAQATAPLRRVLAQLPAHSVDWIEALQASGLVSADVDTPDARAPLLLRGAALYLRRYWQYEQQVAREVLRRCAGTPQIDEVVARNALHRLFPAPVESVIDAAIDWQKVACAIALRAKLTIITGGPGTGKTHTAARLLALLVAVHPAPQRLRVALAAPTGKAAARLGQSIRSALQSLQAEDADAGTPLTELPARIGPARTLHALLGARPDTRQFRFDAAHPLPLDLLIVDEASMIHLEMMAALLAALPADARIVLLGDKDQLASVEAGAVLGELCRDAGQGRYRADTAAFVEAVAGQRIPSDPAHGGSALEQQTVMLRESRRFGGPIAQLALAVNEGDAPAATALLQETADSSIEWRDARSPAIVVQLALQGRAGAEGGYASYVEQLRWRPDVGEPEVFDAWVLAVLRAFDRFRVLCAVREGDWGAVQLNRAIERALQAKGLIAAHGEWYEGRPVMVTRNDGDAGVFNGDIGIVLGNGGGAALRAYFLDGPSVRSVSVGRLPSVDTAFALTVHKAQGSEFEHCVLVLPSQASRVLTRELVYTAVTRARTAFTLVTGRAPALAESLARRTRRYGGLADLVGSGS